MNHKDQPLPVWIESDEIVLVNVLRKSDRICFDNTKAIGGCSVRQAERRSQKMHGLVSKESVQLGRPTQLSGFFKNSTGGEVQHPTIWHIKRADKDRNSTVRSLESCFEN